MPSTSYILLGFYFQSFFLVLRRPECVVSLHLFRVRPISYKSSFCGFYLSCVICRLSHMECGYDLPLPRRNVREKKILLIITVKTRFDPNIILFITRFKVSVTWLILYQYSGWCPRFIWNLINIIETSYRQSVIITNIIYLFSADLLFCENKIEKSVYYYLNRLNSESIFAINSILSC